MPEKNGAYFLSILQRDLVVPGMWDPHSYREHESRKLVDYVQITKIGRSGAPSADLTPIEYRHLHGRNVPTFAFYEQAPAERSRFPSVGEVCLLFGTMRAYLGNALVTPHGSWIGHTSPVRFPVKSEFVRVEPKDGLHYFWWAFLQSTPFLRSLPVGSGGTRPRLPPDHLMNTPVLYVPSKTERERLDNAIRDFAEREWREYVAISRMLATSLAPTHHTH